MKTLLALGMVALPLMAGSMDNFRWKKRVLVVTGASAAVEAKLAEEKDGLDQRDVVVFFLEGETEHERRPDPELERELRKRLKTKTGVTEVFLLGKDGRTTLRWKIEEFSTKELFRKIDVMPMRKNEMKKDSTTVLTLRRGHAALP